MKNKVFEEMLKSADKKVRIYVERFLKELKGIQEESDSLNMQYAHYSKKFTYEDYINARIMLRELIGNLRTIMKRQYTLMSEIDSNNHEEERARKNQFADIMLSYVAPKITDGISKLKFYFFKKSRVEAYEVLKEMKRIEKLVHLLGARQTKEIESLKREVMIDSLTGLFNERYIIEQLKKEVERAKRSKKKKYVSLLFIDVDNFKAINDNYNHLRGDLALKLIAEGLRKYCRSIDTLGRRYRGDEFVIIIPEASPKEVDKIARRIVKEVSNYATIEFAKEVREFRGKIGVSVGCATYGYDANSMLELLKHADEAMMLVKNEGKKGYCRYKKTKNRKKKRHK
ncbi:MAG: GGDEF domain-containing protein [Candidatus Pacearchaeota archaeon]